VVRDMNLVRKLLLEMEKQPYTGNFINVEIEGVADDDITYHVILMSEANLIDAMNLTTMSNIEWQPLRITWQGHEFLDTVRDEQQWQKTLGVVRSRTGGVAFEVVKQLAVQFAKGAVSGATGMPMP
jgi:hypothetical protein